MCKKKNEDPGMLREALRFYDMEETQQSVVKQTTDGAEQGSQILALNKKKEEAKFVIS